MTISRNLKKLIKTEIYQAAVNILTEKIYGHHMICHDDILIMNYIYKLTTKYIIIRVHGILNLNTAVSSTRKPLSKERIKAYIDSQLHAEKAFYLLGKQYQLDVNICYFYFMKTMAEYGNRLDIDNKKTAVWIANRLVESRYVDVEYKKNIKWLIKKYLN